MSHSSRYFLAANTPDGFISYFDELYNPYTDPFAYIIKGGPGTGKSTFMKKIAYALEARGASVERIYCSSDPRSLDGVICPEKAFSVADGTAPHVLEPRFPGAAENIINLGQFWDEQILRKNRDRIISLTLENSLYHRKSTSYLSAAGKLIRQSGAIASEYIREEKIHSFALRFASREFPRKPSGEPGRKYRRLLSAITPEGRVFFGDTVKNSATRIIGIEDRYYEPSSILLERIGEAAVVRGYDVIFCPCPLAPERTEHIIIPEKKLALVSITKSLPVTLPCDRVIHSERFLREEIKENRQLLRFNEGLCRELTDCSVRLLKKAKQTHDLMEKEYAAAMDYEALDRFCSKFIDKLITNFSFGLENAGK